MTDLAEFFDTVDEISFDVSTMPPQLREYWAHGEGAAKIGWGTPGDFARCQTALRAEGVPGRMVDGACASLHKEATGEWPGRGKEHSTMDDYVDTAVEVLTAAASIDAFTNPLFGEPGEDPRLVLQPPTATCAGHQGLTMSDGHWSCDECHRVTEDAKYGCPLTVLPDGRVFGHAALWGTCHIGFDGTCVTPPHSNTNYANFLTKEYVTDDDTSVPVGVISLGTGHAAASLGSRPAAAHYDNTGLAAAYVNAGEDVYGIWLAGALAKKATPDVIEQLRGSSISGDWRRIGGALDMVATLAVNVPGFPISRLQAATTNRRQSALVASGVVVRPLSATPEVLVAAAPTFESIAAAATRQALAAIDRRTRLARIDKRLGVDPASRVARAASLVEGN